MHLFPGGLWGGAGLGRLRATEPVHPCGRCGSPKSNGPIILKYSCFSRGSRTPVCGAVALALPLLPGAWSLDPAGYWEQDIQESRQLEETGGSLQEKPQPLGDLKRLIPRHGSWGEESALKGTV